MNVQDCPACRAQVIEPFYQCLQVPVHSTLLMPTSKQALDYQRQGIELAHCGHCGFITNRLFQPAVHEYSAYCEESQGASPTFTRWMRSLARRLISNYNVRDQTILEIGCGKGEFLATMCELGGSRGIGYDPAYLQKSQMVTGTSELDIREINWDGSCGTHRAKFIACRHTLEHIPNVLGFMQQLRSAIDEHDQPVVFFEVPDTRRVLQEGAFWDVYYEHCSYFDQHSLNQLFTRAGFEVLESWLDYDDQYLMLVARPAASNALQEPNPALVSNLSSVVTERLRETRERWNSAMTQCLKKGNEVALWGGGSKAVAFATQISQSAAIRQVIDIHPRKQGCFLPGTGHAVDGPDSILSSPPDAIILMNPVYRQEVQSWLNEHDCKTILVDVTEPENFELAMGG